MTEPEEREEVDEVGEVERFNRRLSFFSNQLDEETTEIVLVNKQNDTVLAKTEEHVIYPTVRGWFTTGQVLYESEHGDRGQIMENRNNNTKMRVTRVIGTERHPMNVPID